MREIDKLDGIPKDEIFKNECNLKKKNKKKLFAKDIFLRRILSTIDATWHGVCSENKRWQGKKTCLIDTALKPLSS